MTLAPRVEVFTQLSCAQLRHPFNHTVGAPPIVTLYSTLDPLGPHFPSTYATNHTVPSSIQYFNAHISSFSPDADDDDPDGDKDPRRLPSPQCLNDPAVQAGAARLQTIMTTTMGLLSALTTGWWGHFGERHGRTTVLAISTFGLFLT